MSSNPFRNRNLITKIENLIILVLLFVVDVFQVFTSVALFNMLISPLNAFPWVLNGLMEAWVSVKRIQAFLSLDNLDLSEYYQQLECADKAEGKSGAC